VPVPLSLAVVFRLFCEQLTPAIWADPTGRPRTVASPSTVQLLTNPVRRWAIAVNYYN